MKPFEKESLTRALYFLILLILALLYFDRVLSCRLIFIERDLSAFFIPPKFLWVNLLKSGTFPFWNPHQYCGIPLLAALQPGVLYPPHVFYLFLPFPIVWNWLIILHFLLAAVAVYLFLVHMKSSEEGALVGALIFMLSGYLLSVHNLLPHLFAVSWFPLVLLFFLKHFETRQMRYAALVSLFLLMQFLSGAPEILMMSVLALFIVTLFLNTLVVTDANLYSRVRSFVIILFLFVLLSGVQLLPFYELKAQSIRQSGLTYFESTGSVHGLAGLYPILCARPIWKYDERPKILAESVMVKDNLSGHRSILPFDILLLDCRPKALAVCASHGHFSYLCVGR